MHVYYIYICVYIYICEIPKTNLGLVLDAFISWGVPYGGYFLLGCIRGIGLLSQGNLGIGRLQQSNNFGNWALQALEFGEFQAPSHPQRSVSKLKSLKKIGETW